MLSLSLNPPMFQRAIVSAILCFVSMLLVVGCRISAKLSCPMNLQSFPMDTQICPMLFESCSYSRHVCFVHYNVHCTHCVAKQLPSWP